MEKKRSPLADYAVYVLARFLICVIQMLSWNAALALARGIASLLYRVNRRHRLVALDNLRHAFPHLDEPALDHLVRAIYLHLTTMIVEMIRMPRVLHKNTVYHYIQHAGAYDLQWMRWLSEVRKPSLVLVGHFGNWEILNYSSGLVGFRGGVIARRLDNLYLDRFLTQFRRKSGMKLLDKTKDYYRILDMLSKGIHMGIVGDQDAGSRGIFVEYFGRPASTFKSISLLALEYNSPIMVMGAARVGSPMRYVIYLEDIILPEEYAGQPDATRAITQRYTDALERMVRRHPEQYFWLHRRWKTPAPTRRTKRAA